MSYGWSASIDNEFYDMGSGHLKSYGSAEEAWKDARLELLSAPVKRPAKVDIDIVNGSGELIYHWEGSVSKIPESVRVQWRFD